MAELSYLLFDVFAERPFTGNQLAVVPQQLEDGLMQRVANEFNIAETVFLRRTGDAKRPAELRIFTPGREVPFAGHPTIGAAYAIAERLQWIEPGQDAFVLGERVGDISVRIERTAGRVLAWLRTPPVTFERKLEPARCAAALNLTENDLDKTLPPQLASAGNPFVYVALKDREAVDRAFFVSGVIENQLDLDVVGIFLFHRTEEGAYSRMFAPMSGIGEDPATGSATGPLFAYLERYGALERNRTRFVSEQGVKLGRRSMLHVAVERGETPSFDVGGETIWMGEGRLQL